MLWHHRNQIQTAICKPIKSFRHEKYQSDTELSHKLWSIKNNNYNPNILWEILRKHQTYNPNNKRCSLCLNEKLEIARYKGHNLLNKPSEIINKCRHRNKFALTLYDSEDVFCYSFRATMRKGSQLPKISLFHEFVKSTGFLEQIRKLDS